MPPQKRSLASVKKTAPTKKTTARKPPAQVEQPLAPQLPSKGGKCKHPRVCFKVVLFHSKQGDYEGKDTYHWFDEAGAVMFAMRQSRNLDLRAVVSADGKTICQFGPREYDVAAANYSLLHLNELRAGNQEVYDQINQAKRELEGSNPPKKRVLKKR